MSEKTTSKGINRGDVFETIETERTYQDNLSPETLTVGEELVILQNYLETARRAFYDTVGDPHKTPTLHEIRKLAAICVRCMQNHGAPKRCDT